MANDSKRLTKWAFFIFPALYFVDIFLGFNGRLLVVGGLSGRMILFLLSLISLYGYLLYLIIKTKTPIFGFKDKTGFIGSFNLTDWVLTAFLIITALSAFVVPKLKGTSLSYAFDEASCLGILLMYYPISFAIKKRSFSVTKLESGIEILVMLLGLCHLLMYFGETLHAGFIGKMFSLIISMFGGSGQMPAIIFGYGYIRVIYTTSILLVMGIYMLFRHFENLKVIDYFCLLITILAAMSTVTKGLWLGLGAGFAVFAVVYLIIKIKQKDKKSIIRLICVALMSVIIVFVTDSTLFGGIVSIRIQNFFVTSSSPSNEPSHQENPDDVASHDQIAAAESNDTKIFQIKELVKMWKGSPIVGYGYGSYTNSCVRSAEAPYSYEMTAAALLMKTGIIGILAWAAYFICLIVFKAKSSYKTNKTEFWAWIALIVSFGLAVQTNPYLFNFVGITIMLIITITANTHIEQKLNENNDTVSITEE